MTDPIQGATIANGVLKPTGKPNAERATEVRPLVTIDAELFRDVTVSLDVRLGSGRMSVAEVLALTKGSMVLLDQGLDDLVEITLNGIPVARGEIVAVEDSFAVRIVEISPR